jgi:hypothetical protein
LVSKEYKGNSAEISGIYIYIYILVTTNISYILSLQVETVTVSIRALAWVQEWKKKV